MLSESADRISYISELFASVLHDESLYGFPGFVHIRENNPWFTEENVRFGLEHNAEMLSKTNVSRWLSNYQDQYSASEPKTVMLITAGNIPLVGLHDIVCCMAAQHNILLRPSSKDRLLGEWLVTCLREHQHIDISIIDEPCKKFDAVIATGSNNTGRYFDYYFSKYRHIIRKNRNSVAVLSGNESTQELEKLADDIFLYFGMGCRSVNNMLVPEGYNFDGLISVFEKKYGHYCYHNKYANNYDYQKAVKLMNGESFLDAGFFILQRNPMLHSPISVIHYSYYHNIDDISEYLQQHANQLQCVVSHCGIKDEIAFGHSQKPEIFNYSDNIDTLKFLLLL